MNNKTSLLSLAFIFLTFCAGITQANVREEKMGSAITGIINGNSNNPFGVLEFLHWNHDWNSYKYPSLKEIDRAVKLMKEAGIGWVRVDVRWWQL